MQQCMQLFGFPGSINCCLSYGIYVFSCCSAMYMLSTSHKRAPKIVSKVGGHRVKGKKNSTVVHLRVMSTKPWFPSSERCISVTHNTCLYHKIQHYDTWFFSRLAFQTEMKFLLLFLLYGVGKDPSFWSPGLPLPQRLWAMFEALESEKSN